MGKTRTYLRFGDQGAVLLQALVVIAFLAAISAGVLRDDLEYRSRYVLMSAADEARHHALSAEALALQLLTLDSDRNEVDHLSEAWAVPRVFQIEGAQMQARVFDLQGRLNVNGLVVRIETDTGPKLEVDQGAFSLLKELSKQAGADRTVPQRIVEWTSSQAVRLPGAAGDRPYLTGSNPYLRPAAALLSSRDLRLVDGVTSAVFPALLERVSALPEVTAINVNTAPRAVLEALTQNARARSIDALIRDRAAKPFKTVAEFESYVADNFAPRVSDTLGELALDVKTEWFLLELVVERDGVVRTLYSVLHRPYEGDARVHFRSGAPQ